MFGHVANVPVEIFPHSFVVFSLRAVRVQIIMLLWIKTCEKCLEISKTFVVGEENLRKILTSKATSACPWCEETESITIALFFVMANGKNLNLIYAFWVFVASSPSLFTCHCKDNVIASSSAFFGWYGHEEKGTKKCCLIYGNIFSWRKLQKPFPWWIYLSPS